MDIIKERSKKNKWKNALSIGASVMVVAVSAGLLYATINEVKNSNSKGE